MFKKFFIASYLFLKLFLLCLEGEKDTVKSIIKVFLVDGVRILEDGVLGGEGTAETKVGWGEMHEGIQMRMN